MTFHNCGGTILAGPDYRYCDRCAAFAYDGILDKLGIG